MTRYHKRINILNPDAKQHGKMARRLTDHHQNNNSCSSLGYGVSERGCWHAPQLVHGRCLGPVGPWLWLCHECSHTTQHRHPMSKNAGTSVLPTKIKGGHRTWTSPPSASPCSKGRRIHQALQEAVPTIMAPQGQPPPTTHFHLVAVPVHSDAPVPHIRLKEHTSPSMCNNHEY